MDQYYMSSMTESWSDFVVNVPYIAHLERVWDSYIRLTLSSNRLQGTKDPALLDLIGLSASTQISHLPKVEN
jgi:hypothetical protein